MKNFDQWWATFVKEAAPSPWECDAAKDIAQSAWRASAENIVPGTVLAAFETAAELCDRRARHHRAMGHQTLLKDMELMALAIRSMKGRWDEQLEQEKKPNDRAH